jgi:phosphoglycerate dehydrogenase-like enzyme
VSIHVPLTSDTHRLIDTAKLSLMKPTAYLINTSRGPVVDEQALVAALLAGRIAGAGLDVYEVEPLPAESPLLKLDNVTMTPHCASFADETVHNMWRRVGQEAALTLRGEMPNTPVNAQIRPNLRWLNG